MAKNPKNKAAKGGGKKSPGAGKKPGGTRASGPQKKGPARLWLYGRHAVAAALANPDRRVRRVLATKNAADWLKPKFPDLLASKKFEDAKPDAIDRALPAGAVHQGVAAEVFDLERHRLKEVCAPDGDGKPVLVLDQITDPQNIGAIFRAAAAFGAKAVIVQERRTPPLSGALAKAAAGAVELVPCVAVVNIARAIQALKGLGYFTMGLAGEAEQTIAATTQDKPVAIVLGAEGAGLRQLVSETCDTLVRIPISAEMESLNVSTAASIALYDIAARKGGADG